MSFDPKAHLTDLRGRDYLEVKWRLVWFREDHPTGGITTEILNYEPLVIRATIVIDGSIIATGHGTADDSGKNVVWKGKAIEKAETAAIGRALAHAGYGTQFSPDDDEDGVVDSPVERAQQPENTQKSAPATTTPQPAQNAAKFIVDSFQVNTAKGGKPYLVFTVGSDSAYSFTRDPLRKAGYNVDGWDKVGNYELPVAAEITVAPNKGGKLEVVHAEMVEAIAVKRAS